MNTQLKELYRQAGDAVEPAGDVTQVLTRAQRRRTATQVATPLATAAVVAGAVGVTASQPWVDDSSEPVAQGDQGTAGHAASLPEPATVAGNTYKLDESHAKAMPDSATLEITFHQGTYSAFAGCNTFRGRYDMRDDVLVASNRGATAGFCPGGAKADRWLQSFLGSGPTVSIDGERLRLNNGESDVVLSVQERPDKPLAGTDWKLDSVVVGEDGAASVASVPKNVSSTLSYDGSQTLAVEAGCSSSTASVDVTSDSLEVGDQDERSAGDCSGRTAQVDQRVEEVLHGSVGYDIEGSQLRIHDEDGALVYTAS